VTRLTCLTGSVTEGHCWQLPVTHQGTVETAEPCHLTDKQHHVSLMNNLFHCLRQTAREAGKCSNACGWSNNMTTRILELSSDE